jgi:hypothetical protein
LSEENGLYDIDGKSGKQSIVWQPSTGWIEHCGHGPNGQMLAVLRGKWGTLKLLPGLYVYDAARSFGRFYEANGEAGDPVFMPGLPVRAAVTIGEDLWEVTWPHDDDGEIRVERRERGLPGVLVLRALRRSLLVVRRGRVDRRLDPSRE